MSKIPIYRYACLIARAVAGRSEDPHVQVGAVAFDRDNRIVATGYNGLLPSIELPSEIWNNREKRLNYVVHAEQNMCSMFKRGQVDWMFSTLSPCLSCAKLFAAHGGKKIVFEQLYNREDFTSILRYTQLRAFQYDIETDSQIEISNELNSIPS